MTNSAIKNNPEFLDYFLKSINAAKENFRIYGVLDEKDKKTLLDCLDDGCSEAFVIKLLLENYYRSGELSKYFSLLSKQRENLDKGLYIVLQDPENIFFNSYIKALSETPHITISKSLIEAFVNFRNKEALSLNDVVVLLYLSTYIGDEEYYSELLELCKDDLPFLVKVKLELFRARFFNDRMGKVYDKLLSKAVPDGVECGFFDALHLTPLHYAIMTRNEDIVQKVLLSGNWFENPAPFEDGIAGTVYDYVFEAVLIFGNNSLIKEILKYTRYRMKPLFDSYDRVENLISINESLYERSHDIALKDRISDLESMGDEIDSEINHLVRKEIMEEAAKARLIYETRHSFACFMIKFYQDIDSVYKNVMETISACKLFNFKNLYFITTADTKINLSYVKIIDDEIAEKNIISKDALENNSSSKRRNAKYKNPFFKKKEGKDYSSKKEPLKDNTLREYRFFSGEALTNINVLKKQYHTLVKKYHPDANDSAESDEIIREIIEERAMILSNFCQ